MITIRKACSLDIPLLMRFIRELADFEEAPDEVINTEALMLKEGFGESPAFVAFIAEDKGISLGVAITYFRYSTWKGKRLFLEDLIVTKEHRGKGVGKLLMQHVIRYARAEECSGVMWQVLDWNEPAIEFYKSIGARLDSEWINCHLDF